MTFRLFHSNLGAISFCACYHGHHGLHGDGFHRHHLPQGLPQRIQGIGADLRQVRHPTGRRAARSQDFSFFMYYEIYNSPTADALKDPMNMCLVLVPLAQWRKVLGSWYFLKVMLKCRNDKIRN